MGGKAFPDLYTPRMPTDVYRQMCNQVLLGLRTIYSHAEIPIEAPEKGDFGDVDVIVCNLRRISNNDETRLLAGHDRQVSDNIKASVAGTALDLIASIERPPITHFAIPWPNSHLHLLPPRSPQDETKTAAVQVDVTVMESWELYQWTLFSDSHGDAFAILGSMVRPFGLTLSRNGLYLRIEELEKEARHNRLKDGKRAAQLLVSTNPTQVQCFLGTGKLLERTQPIPTLATLFDHISECRFFKSFEGPAAMQGTDSISSEFMNVASEKARSKQLKERPVLRQWCNEYIRTGAAHNRPHGEWACLNRAQIIDKTVQWFDIKEEYKKVLHQGRREASQNRCKEDLSCIVQAILNGESQTQISEAYGPRGAEPNIGSIKSRFSKIQRGLKSYIFDGEREADTDALRTEGLDEAQNAWKDADWGKVKSWVTKHWRAIEEGQVDNERGKMREAMERKARLRAAQEATAAAAVSEAEVEQVT